MAGKQGSGSRGTTGKVPPRPGGRATGPRPVARSSGSGAGARPATNGNRGAASTARPVGAASRPGRASARAPRVSARQLAQRQRQRNIRLAMGGTGGVLAVVVVIVLVLLLSGNGSPTDTGAYAIPQSAINEVTAVPVNQLVTQAMAVAESTSSNPGALPPEKLPSSNPALSVGGKPAFIYMGGEYCPYCAAERWSLVMALSKFGTFSGLKGTTSSATDVDASTPTFSFYGSKFTSRYITFEPVELYKNFGENLTTGVWPAGAHFLAPPEDEAPPSSRGRAEKPSRGSGSIPGKPGHPRECEGSYASSGTFQ